MHPFFCSCLTYDRRHAWAPSTRGRSRSPYGRDRPPRRHSRSRSPLDRDRERRDRSHLSRSHARDSYLHEERRHDADDRRRNEKGRSTGGGPSETRQEIHGNGDEDNAMEEGEVDEEQQMVAMLGFGGFTSTKGKHVPGVDMSGVNIKKVRTYRQYMNRRGGFNRALDAVP
ncbi:MAG: hypothetical protein BJ554DRAFT_2364 [Olpidium bornovanus]|uniref:U4/U6.U5 small nuclear ribonucleoprotein 27kDa protein domain-containing protein n=1 Tax=Olpidium bornovanus TaxID=278681 RepID=A0A8H8DGG7_9FUNG|nr:MAG: hypothetical protein BJ554DRAFT_2364 [Olpidium bornovanus]